MKNVFSKILHGFVYPGCTVFTALLLIFMLIYGSFTNLAQKAATVEQIVYLLIFALLLVLGNLILKIKKLPAVLKVLLHYLSYLASFVVVFFVFMGVGEGFSSAFILSVVFSVIYLLVLILVLVVKGIAKRSGKQPDNYKTMF